MWGEQTRGRGRRRVRVAFIPAGGELECDDKKETHHTLPTPTMALLKSSSVLMPSVA